MGYFLLAVFIFAVEFLPSILLGEPANLPFLPFVHPYLVAATVILVFAIIRLLALRPYKNFVEFYYFVLPLILLWSGNYFFLYRVHLPVRNPILSAVTGMALSAFITGTVRALKRKRDNRAAYGTKNFLLFIAMLSYFLAVSVSYSLYIFQPRLYNLAIVLGAVFASTWVVIGFLYFLHDRNDKRSALTNLTLSLVASEIAWALSFWAVFYVPRFFPSNRENAAIPLAAVIISVVVLYVIWGILSHRDEHKLSKRIMYEYLAVGGVVTSFLLVSTRWYLG